MTLRKRLFIGLIIISINTFILWMISTRSIGRISASIDEVRKESNQVPILTAQISTCLTELQMQIERYFDDTQNLKSKEILEKSEECKALIGATNAFDKASSQITDYTKTVLEIGTRIHATDNALRLALSDLETLTLTLRKSNKTTHIADKLNKFALAVSRQIVVKEPFDPKFIESEIQKILDGIHDETSINTKLKSNIEDTLVDLVAVTSVWTRTIEQTNKSYLPKRLSISSIPSSIPLHYIKDLEAKSDDAVKEFKVASFWGSFSILLFLITMVLVFIWIEKKWSTMLKKLKLVCTQIVNGDLSVSNDLTKIAGSGNNRDDLEIAYETIGKTLHELYDLKISLEERVTDRTKSLEDAQQKLVQSGKLAALGTMAAGVAHELNNPLAVILSLAERLEKPDLALDRRLKYIEQIKPHVHRMAKIIEQLKRLSRAPKQTDNVPHAIADMIQNTLTLLQPKIKDSTIAIQQNIPKGVLLTCDSVKIESVFQNLIGNAIDALNEDKSGTTAQQIAIGFELSDDPQWCSLAVADNGKGIPKELHAKIFDPFFTTKEIGKGTGLGLSLCFQIIEELGGHLELDSEVGRGTKFTIKLPKTLITIEDIAA